jgi:hypothetical protein
MSDSQALLTGVIEGFYGRVWSFETRLRYAHYLSTAGLNTYLYCPKGDPYLRRQWRSDWPLDEWTVLRQLSRAYRAKGLNWGVGLSPVELYRDYGPGQRDQLQRKVERLNEFEAPIMAILFDDMPGDLASLATRQSEIIADVCSWAPGVRILMCPTYYSFDPVLQQFFGQMPPGYWEQLGRELPADCDVFWTGNKVCSDTISAEDLEAITARLQRRVTLWDNYPVNDGAKRSNFLYTSQLSGRPAALRPLIRGHLCNPMNQGLLSLPALTGLAQLYGHEGFDDAALRHIFGPETWERLCLDRDAFETEGLTGLGAQGCRDLADKYARLPGAAALEITQWLRGEYAFDPACLTD